MVVCNIGATVTIVASVGEAVDIDAVIVVTADGFGSTTVVVVGVMVTVVTASAVPVYLSLKVQVPPLHQLTAPQLVPSRAGPARWYPGWWEDSTSSTIHT